MTTFGLPFLLALSLAVNAVQLYLLRTSKKRPAPTLEAKDVMAQMLKGNAVVHIRVLDPENLMLRSPRG